MSVWLIVFGGIMLFGILLIVHMVMEAYKTNITEVEVELIRLDPAFDGTRLFFISDIHRRTIDSGIVEQIKNKYQPELVLVGGDVTERGVPFPRVQHNIAQLKKIAPVYIVYGNHDYDTDYRRLDNLLRDMGVTILLNESVLLEKQNRSLWLAGVDDPHKQRDNLNLALADVNESQCCILLAHDPSIVHKITTSGHSIDLVLSGHTHGGQVCLPWIGPPYTATRQSEYVVGHYTAEHDRIGHTKVFVSRGFGTSRMPIRLLCPSEMHIVTLRSGAIAKR